MIRIPKAFAKLTIAFLAVAGLAFIALSVSQWQAVKIQTELGNVVPLAVATLKMAGGMIYMICVWFWLKATRNQ